MRLDKVINKIEGKWFEVVKDFFEDRFKTVWLPSHNFEHHERVWGYARQQIEGLVGLGHVLDEGFVEALYIACMLHDIGLSKTLDESHGKVSMEIAVELLERQAMFSPKYREEMLEAIVLHDDKSYLNKKAGERQMGIYPLLTVADDMDALGVLGVFRYIEIYGRRDVSPHEMVGKIRNNIEKRYAFIAANLHVLKDLFMYQAKRYTRSLDMLSSISPLQIEALLGLFERHIGLEALNRSLLNDAELLNWVELAKKERSL